MEGRLQRAELLRSSHLQEIVRKAQEEDAKVRAALGTLATKLTACVCVSRRR